MRPPAPLPSELAGRPFSREQAIDAGLTSRMLQHRRFERLYSGVYVESGTTLDPAGRIMAASLALPPEAKVSHQTRLKLLGLDVGEPMAPMRFTIDRDHHLDIDGVTLHRTKAMPPVDGVGVTASSAFIGVASLMKPIDTVAIGDWLLHRGHLDPAVVAAIAHRDDWRAGAEQAVAALRHLDGRSRSLPESEVRCLLWAAGLPEPEVNADIADDDGQFLGCGDLVLRAWRLVVEYEGRQHAFDVQQFGRDIDRYAGFRRAGWAYVQVTAETRARPRQMVGQIYAALVAQGYDGPPPRFGRDWLRLFERPAAPGHRRAVAEQPHSAK